MGMEKTQTAKRSYFTNADYAHRTTQAFNHGYYFLVKSHKATTWQSQVPIHHGTFLLFIFNKIRKNDAHSRTAQAGQH